MKRSTNVLIQIFALVINVLNAATSFIPPGGKPWIGLGIVLAQGIVAIIAHNYNPNGTPANASYTPDKSASGTIDFNAPLKAVSLILIPLCLVGLVGCGKPKVTNTVAPVDPLHEIARTSAELSASLVQLNKIKTDLHNDKLISDATDHKINLALLKVAPRVKDFNAKAKTYTSFDLTSKAVLAKLFRDISDELQTITPSDLAINNPQRQAEAQAILSSITLALQSLAAYFDIGAINGSNPIVASADSAGTDEQRDTGRVAGQSNRSTWRKLRPRNYRAGRSLARLREQTDRRPVFAI
jgi:hypothetical protein